MCGISGIWQYPAVSQPDSSRLNESGRLMSHRGPDHRGVFADDGVGLVHTRLSLLDLNERSNQPFLDPSASHVLVYNGEIYNFREIRDLLATQGIKFETTGDTEVLLHCLIRFGLSDTLTKLEGMFAFAWYDRNAQTLTLARDRFGMKPLFYHDDGQTLFFASEARALRPWVAMRPDYFSIAAWSQTGRPPTQGFTHYSGVRILPPGTTLLAARGGPPRMERYFELLSFRDADYAEALRRRGRRELVDEVDETLNASVAMQLAADAPVGAFCSGGVDSSVVMAMAAKKHDNLAIFHANVVGRHSEREAAQRLASHLKLDLLSADVEDHHFLDILPEVTRHFGHPISYRHDSIPLFMVSRLVRQHGVRAVLSGEGSDEIFLGYDWLMPRYTEALARMIPRRSTMRKLAKRLVTWGHETSKAPRRSEYLTPGLLTRFEVDIENKARQEAGTDKDTRSIRMLTYHLRTLLHRNDAIGMSSSIECRFPMLDSQLVRLAVNLPFETKIRRSWRVRDRRHPFIQNKWILREVASRYMPASLSLRPKRPFPTNTFARLNIPASYFIGSAAADLLELSRREIGFLVAHGQPALKVRLMHLNVWCDVCLNDEPPDEVAARLRQAITITPDKW
jgi:asparagine synthase (glutamine-hydrolysing)